MATRPPCDEAVRKHFADALQLGLVDTPELTGAAVLFSWRPGLDAFHSILSIPPTEFTPAVMLNLLQASVALQRQLIEQLGKIGIELGNTLEGMAKELATKQAEARALNRIEQQ